HTDRFKAAVTLRSVSNFISDDGTRDGAYGHAPDFGGDIFQKFDLYWDRSPLKYAKNVKTPTLILHSDNDFRVPIEQGEQWFRALQHLGVPSEIVFFPRENHNLTRRRAAAPGREHRVAGLLVRSLSERQRERGAPGRAGAHRAHQFTGSPVATISGLLVTDLSSTSGSPPPQRDFANICWVKRRLRPE